MKSFVAVLMGSDSDFPVMQSASIVLEEFAICHEINIISAHRTPEAIRQYIKDAEIRGCQVFIAAAGLAAHLAGAVAALTTKPVIGVPLPVGALQGIDALLSTVQMPSGIPVATVAIGGAKNAALLAAQMLALSDDALRKKLLQQRQLQATQVQEKNAKLQRELNET